MAFESRKRYAKQVAKTFDDHHSKQNESFIFGVSGRWGEGKTDFLSSLKEELEILGFTVVSINPWKYAEDKIAFLRYFILQLSKYVEEPDRFYKKEKLGELQYDISEDKIRIGWMVALFVILILAIGAYAVLQYFLQVNVLSDINQCVAPSPVIDKIAQVSNRYQQILIPAWGLLMLPVIINLLEKVSSKQVSKSAVSTIDRFDDILVKIVKNLGNKRMVIFVDDLDRVDPKVARGVLDNLRTFFDRPEISYIVTADHTVLERYIGSEVLPDADTSEQLEEGRRFWKKIFNYYWRLPVPVDSEFDGFLQEKIEPNRGELEQIFGSDLTRFKQYLSKYFNKNLREVIRFMDHVIFTFRLLRMQIDDSQDAKQKERLTEVTANPLLMLKVLLMQELASGLFEEILQNTRLLTALEFSAAKGNQSRINDELVKLKASHKISNAQEKFLLQLLAEEESFYSRRSPYHLQHDVGAFVYLASDASFGENIGAKGDDFANAVETGEIEGVKEALITSASKSLTECSDALLKLFGQGHPVEKRAVYLQTICKALVGASESAQANDVFFGKLINLEMQECISVPDQETKLATIFSLLEWLDLLAESKNIEEFNPYFEKLNFLTNDDILLIANKIPKGGVFTAKIIVPKLIELQKNDKVRMLERMLTVFPKLDKEIIKEYLEDDYLEISKEALKVNNTELWGFLLKLLQQYIPTAVESFKNELLNKLKDLADDALYEWAYENAAENSWKKSDIEDAIIDSLRTAEDRYDIDQVVLYAGKKDRIKLKKNEFWEVLLAKEQLLPTLQQTLSYPNLYTHIQPSPEEAEKLFTIILNKLKASQDDAEKIQLAEMLKKNQWYWPSTFMPDGRKNKSLQAIYKADNPTLRQKGLEILQQWGIEIPSEEQRMDGDA